ncbi:MAG: glycerol-3-phosphate 1-O-acyltransferase PlsY [Clostridiales bacterium]|nr:glycerol-3-phosphate 1-O-acyltransferase PlsY [Candidatus Crickella merdequi]
MPKEVVLVLIGIFAYAIGCISPSIMLGRLAGIDIKKEGSGNAGTTNTLRVLGGKAALIVLCVDILKGFIAVKTGYQIGREYGAMIAFACVVLGHVFPAIHKFKGGKGVATCFGAALALDFPSAFALLVIAAIGVGYSRKMSVGSMLAAVCYPLLMWFYMPDHPNFIYGAIVMALFVLFTHRSNIKRLIKHEEPNLNLGDKLGLFKKQDDYDESEKSDDEVPAMAHADAVAQEFVEPEPVDYYEGIEIPQLGKEEKLNIGVVGSGSFGTAVANMLVHNGHNVTLFGRNKEAIDKMRETRMNEKYLPYVILSDKIKYTNTLKTAVNNKDIVVFAVPAQSFRNLSKRAVKNLKEDAVVVNLAKGIEQKTLKRMSEIAEETMPGVPYVVLSGPSHAEEVVRNYPSALVAASENKDAAAKVQDAFMNDKFRVYTHDDVTGVELGGAIKNVIAIATGISDGKKFGNNARAALMTRATHEISRLGNAMNADPATFAGLTGIGDLMVTCSTNLSRNRRCGLFIGLGLTPEEAVERVGSTVEGFYTAKAAKQLADKLGVDMPITQTTYKVLKGDITPDEALDMLMLRDKKEETK